MAFPSPDMKAQQNSLSTHAGPSYQPLSHSPSNSPLQRVPRLQGFRTNTSEATGSSQGDGFKINGTQVHVHVDHQHRHPEAIRSSSQVISSLRSVAGSPKPAGIHSSPPYNVISPRPLLPTSLDGKHSTSLPWQVTSAKRQAVDASMAASSQGNAPSVNAFNSQDDADGRHNNILSSNSRQLPTRPYTPPPKQQWTIADCPPPNPRDAFAIIISPNARPPPHIVSRAIVMQSPSESHSYSDASKTNEAFPGHSNEAAERSSSPDFTQLSSVLQPITTSPTPYIETVISPQSKQLSYTVPNNATVKQSDGNDDEPSTALPTSPKAATLSATPNKKSWASLLRNNDTLTSSAKNHSLPMSPVVGFSIPAYSAGTAIASPSPIFDKQSRLLSLLTTGAEVTEFLEPIHPRGLVNTGNICFANVVLQVLVYCAPFHCLFSSLGKIIGEGDDDRSSDSSLINAMVRFFREFKPQYDGEAKRDVAVSDSFIPSYVYEALKDKRRFDNLRSGQQEDAEEFLGFLLDTIEEELIHMKSILVPEPQNKVDTASSANTSQTNGWVEVGRRNKVMIGKSFKSHDSPITKIFGGKFRSTLRVPGQKDSILMEDWRALQLDIQKEHVNTIEDALRCISLPQSVQVASVTKGGALVDASQQLLVESLPSILVLHLKRFLYDTAAKGVVKINKHIEYQGHLEIPHDILTPARRSAKPVKYQLFAVLYHHGLSAGGGHYTLDVLHSTPRATASAREGWIRIDDELVSDLRAEDVFQANLEDRSAYLLFYRKSRIAPRV